MKLAVTGLVLCVAALLALGLVILYSSSMPQVGAHYLLKQLVAVLAGLGLCAFLERADPRDALLSAAGQTFAALGPGAVRRASDLLETYAPAAGLDLDDLLQRLVSTAASSACAAKSTGVR